MLTLSSSFPSSCVTFNTTSNGVVEEDKMFSVSIGMVQPMGVTVMPSRANVSITESDCECIVRQF